MVLDNFLTSIISLCILGVNIYYYNEEFDPHYHLTFPLPFFYARPNHSH